jgi:mRNA interferase RelE/StbE
LAVAEKLPRPRLYRIEVTPAAYRDLGKLKNLIKRQDYERLRDAVRCLAVEPRPEAVRKIKGTEKAYRIRVGSYRVIDKLHDNEKLVLILQIVRRSETTYHS